MAKMDEKFVEYPSNHVTLSTVQSEINSRIATHSNNDPHVTLATIQSTANTAAATSMNNHLNQFDHTSIGTGTSGGSMKLFSEGLF